MKNPKLIVLLLTAILLSMAIAPPAGAQSMIENPDVTIAVDGLSCPFCAYGLEKKLKKLEGIEAISVHMEEGQVRMKLKEGATLTEKQINEAVTDAGFTATEIMYLEKGISGANQTGKR